MMGIKVDAGKVTQRLEGLAKQYGNRAAKVVEVGVTDASIAEYAQYVEFGSARHAEAIAFPEWCHWTPGAPK